MIWTKEHDQAVNEFLSEKNLVRKNDIFSRQIYAPLKSAVSIALKKEMSYSLALRDTIISDFYVKLLDGKHIYDAPKFNFILSFTEKAIKQYTYKASKREQNFYYDEVDEKEFAYTKDRDKIILRKDIYNYVKENFSKDEYNSFVLYFRYGTSITNLSDILNLNNEYIRITLNKVILALSNHLKTKIEPATIDKYLSTFNDKTTSKHRSHVKHIEHELALKILNDYYRKRKTIKEIAKKRDVEENVVYKVVIRKHNRYINYPVDIGLFHQAKKRKLERSDFTPDRTTKINAEIAQKIYDRWKELKEGEFKYKKRGCVEKVRKEFERFGLKRCSINQLVHGKTWPYINRY